MLFAHCLLFANEMASLIAMSKLPTSALPDAAKSSAVPWSTEVRIKGNPKVMFTA